MKSVRGLHELQCTSPTVMVKAVFVILGSIQILLGAPHRLGFPLDALAPIAPMQEVGAYGSL